MAAQVKPFWKTKTLAEMTAEEWESLCDGCAKCCLVKLQDEDTDKVYYTNVACQFLDLQHCRCTSYGNRTEQVEACVKLTADKVDEFFWLPVTCAYRLLAGNKDLPSWHPLVSGSAHTVYSSGCSVKGKVIAESSINPDDIEDYVIRWVK